MGDAGAFGGVSGWDFFDAMLRNANVVITPGSGFGRAGEGWFRLSAFNTRANALIANQNKTPPPAQRSPTRPSPAPASQVLCFPFTGKCYPRLPPPPPSATAAAAPPPPTMPALSSRHRHEFWEFANNLADRAADLLRTYHARTDTEIEIKPDGSPVTIADKDCERHLRQWIAERYPDHGVIGEEFGEDRPNAEFVWILDPIDGTKSFIPRVPLYGLLFGLLHEGAPALGVIDQPVTRQRVIGDGETTLYNGHRASVGGKRHLDQALLLTTDIKNVAAHHDETAWNRLVAHAGLFRTWGDCYGHLMVAAGLADIMADPILNPWDILPLVPVLRGAGATISDWKGGDAIASGNIIAANPWLHEQTLSILNNKN